MKTPSRASRQRSVQRLPWLLPDDFPASGIPTTTAWLSDIVAVQALEQGTADEFQQRLAWRFINDVLCLSEKQTFFPNELGGDRTSAFAEGVRWVGRQLRMIVRLKLKKVDIRGEPPAMPSQKSDEVE